MEMIFMARRKRDKHLLLIEQTNEKGKKETTKKVKNMKRRGAVLIPGSMNQTRRMSNLSGIDTFQIAQFSSFKPQVKLMKDPTDSFSHAFTEQKNPIIQSARRGSQIS